MEKEKDEMLEAYISAFPVEEREEIETQKTEEDLESERLEQERIAKEEAEKATEPTEEEKLKEQSDKAEQERLAQEELDKAGKVETKIEPVDNSEWLKSLEEAVIKKNQYKSLSAEQKALAFLKEKHPSLNDEDLIFEAAQEYGIGVTDIDLEDLSEEDKRAIKKQEIKRKELMYEADTYFKQQSDAIELPTIPNPIETDEDYKSYKEFVAQQKAQEVEIQKQQLEINTNIDTTSSKLEKIEIEPKITLDEREFSFKSEFKLDENKRKQLAEFAKVYTPTQEEIDEYFPQDGKLNMDGYLSHLATIKFQKQIINSAVKEGIARAREEFVEKDLKNSTLRNNETTQQSNREVDPMIAAMLA